MYEKCQVRLFGTKTAYLFHLISFFISLGISTTVSSRNAASVVELYFTPSDFCSPKGQGLYLSVLLRPKAGLEQLLTLTGWAAVALREGIQTACGASAGIKWLNDLYLGRGKLCGILTELALLGESGEPDYVVLGAGVNLTQTARDFQAQGLEGVATSLALEGFFPERHHLAACILAALEEMIQSFPQRQEDYLARYRTHCLTLGRPVAFQADGEARSGTALAVTDRFALEVTCPDGTHHTLSSGSIIQL